MMISHSLNTYVDCGTINTVSEPFSFYVIYSFLVSRESLRLGIHKAWLFPFSAQLAGGPCLWLLSLILKTQALELMFS